MAQSPDGKQLATIQQIDDEKRYAIAIDDQGRTYFCYERYFDQMAHWTFDDLSFGSVVKFVATSGPKGLRAVDIQIVKL